MLSASPDQSQWDMFSPILKSFIDPQHPLVQLADTLDWCQLETEFTELYSKTGRPAHPIRLMVSLLLLKQMYGHGDENLLLAGTAWNLQLWMRQLLCWLKILLRFVNPLSRWTILKPSF